MIKNGSVLMEGEIRMMMNVPLTIHSMMERAETLFPKKEIISRTHDRVTTLTYKQIGERTRRLSSVLKKLGVNEGERIGTLAWNHHRHVEAYFAIPGIGSVLHTINIRLSPQHISYIVNHAEDRILLIDEDLVPLVEKIQGELSTVQAYIIMTDKEEIPETSLTPVYHYEHLLAEGNPKHQFLKEIDENMPAGMCYTSATTGNPKGVVYTHRSTVLHCMALGLADTATAIGKRCGNGDCADVSCECMGITICGNVVWNEASFAWSDVYTENFTGNDSKRESDSSGWSTYNLAWCFARIRAT